MSDHSASAELLRDRLARNEAVYRDVNEQIDALNSLGPALPRFPIVCECASEGCAETWSFLERRIANVMQISQLRARLDDIFKNFGRLNPMAQRR